MGKLSPELTDRLIGLAAWVALNSTSSIVHEAQAIIDQLPDRYFFTDADGRQLLRTPLPKVPA